VLLLLKLRSPPPPPLFMMKGPDEEMQHRQSNGEKSEPCRYPPLSSLPFSSSKVLSNVQVIPPFPSPPPFFFSEDIHADRVVSGMSSRKVHALVDGRVRRAREAKEVFFFPPPPVQACIASPHKKKRKLGPPGTRSGITSVSLSFFLSFPL